MSKTLDRLQRQLTTDLKQDAEDCIKIYNKLSELYDGSVWSSHWGMLTDVKFKGLPSDERTFKPSKIGYIFIKGIEL